MLAGVMRGCGRQRIGATINLVTYWLFGLPVACLMAFPGGYQPMYKGVYGGVRMLVCPGDRFTGCCANYAS